MIAEVVPVIRLRRSTSWWSYKIPAGWDCHPGSVVRVTFRGRDVLGVVWSVRKESPRDIDVLEMSAIVLEKPVVRQPSRSFIEYLAEKGFCSLSTATYQWMPRVLRKPGLSQPVLKAWQAAVAAFDETRLSSQQMSMWPSERPYWVARLRQAGRDTLIMNSELTEYEEWCAWLRIWKGEAVTVVGRERALFAPFANLREASLLDPEDVSYYHEQIPYIWMTDAAAALSGIYKAEIVAETVLDASVVKAFWPQAKKLPAVPPRAEVEITDLRHEPVLNPRLMEKVGQAAEAGRSAIILYNAHDRPGKGGKIIPGIETVRKRIAARLGLSRLPAGIVVDTRKLFDHPPIRPLFTAVLSADPLLDTPVLANQLHGLADIIKLTRYPVPCVIQSYQPGHPLIQAAAREKLDEYQQNLMKERKKSDLPPYIQQIVAAYPAASDSELPDEVKNVFEAFKEKGEETWQIGDPVLSKMGKKLYWNILIIAPLGVRLPASASTYLASLEKPWRVFRDPWHLL